MSIVAPSPPLPYRDVDRHVRLDFDAAARRHWGRVPIAVRCGRCGEAFELQHLLVGRDATGPVPVCSALDPQDGGWTTCPAAGFEEMRPA